jgi:hypothetical protein
MENDEQMRPRSTAGELVAEVQVASQGMAIMPSGPG